MTMIDYVLEQDKHKEVRYKQIVDYANFLKQPLTLGMFIPCDKDGNISVPPQNKWQSNEERWGTSVKTEYWKAYEKEKESVLFEGWELNQKDISKLKNVICITRGRIQLSFFKKDNQIFFDHLLNGTTKIIKTIEDLVPQQLELTKK